MFCPYCGAPASIVDGELACSAYPDDAISQVLTKEFVGWNTAHPSPSLSTGPRRIGGSWWCVHDGSKMEERSGAVFCDICGRHMEGLMMYQLIEFRSHPRATA